MDYSALIVVDVQNAFIEGGTLPVPHGAEVVPVINRIAPVFVTRRHSLHYAP